MNSDYLKIPELKDGYLYEIDARNATYGIWVANVKGFAISRIKFGSNFVFIEYHWDCESFATAKPIREIEKSPFTLEYFQSKDSDDEILEYLNKFGEGRWLDDWNKYVILLRPKNLKS